MKKLQHVFLRVQSFADHQIQNKGQDLLDCLKTLHYSSIPRNQATLLKKNSDTQLSNISLFSYVLKAPFPLQFVSITTCC